MKKLLFVLLVAIATCAKISVIEEENYQLRSLPDWIKTGFSDLKEVVKNIIEFFKEVGFWDIVVQKFEECGKQYAVNICKIFGDDSFCDEVFNNIIPKLLK